MLRFGLIASILLLVSANAAIASENFVLISEKIRIVDGDTITLDGKKIRLLGIDAPELQQQCQDAEGNPWHCGARARDMLVGMLAAAPSPVSCRITGQDRYKRLLGRCYAGSEDAGLDVQRALVRSGLAVAEYTRDYLTEEDQAQTGKLGLWAGKFDRPKDWRQSRRQKNESGG
ncbi:thermonuclease family protein [Alphaproteobacteria bacterium LSUCC0684]